MKCIIPDANAKVFAKFIQFLSRVGDELFLEASSTGLSLRTINSTKSSFAMVTFLPNFFIDYTEKSDSQNLEANKCRLSMKAVLGVFKNMKTVTQCSLKLEPDTSRIQIRLACQDKDVVREYYVNILEFDSLQAFYMNSQFPNQLHSNYDTFSDIVSSFRPNEEEITFDVNQTQMIAKNYIEGVVDSRFLKSQLKVSPNEFGRYQIDEETSITFCLREFRALLNIAEIFQLNVHANFETTGKPVIFILKSLDMFEINLVMSTVKDDNDISYIPNTSITRKSLNNKENNGEAVDSEKITSADRHRKRRKVNVIEEDDDDDEIFNFIPAIEAEDPTQIRRNSQCSSVLIPTQSFRENAEGRRDLFAKQPATCSVPISSENLDTEDVEIILQDSDELINKFAIGNARQANDEDLDRNTQMNIDEDEDDYVPKSPVTNTDIRERTRFIFRRCFESTFNPASIPGANQILAEDSDPE